VSLLIGAHWVVEDPSYGVGDLLDPCDVYGWQFFALVEDPDIVCVPLFFRDGHVSVQGACIGKEARAHCEEYVVCDGHGVLALVDPEEAMEVRRGTTVSSHLRTPMGASSMQPRNESQSGKSVITPLDAGLCAFSL